MNYLYSQSKPSDHKPTGLRPANNPARRDSTRRLAFTGIVALVLALPVSTSAACLTCTCTVSSTPVAFGVYDPTSASPLNVSGNVLLTCAGLVGGVVDYGISLNTGANSVNFSPRRMASGANLLNYDLYTSSAYAAIWGDGTAGSQTVTGSVTILLLAGTTQIIPVSGRIPGSQSTAKTGVYSDALVVTVTYN